MTATVEDFQEELEEEGTGIGEFISDEHESIIEMFETGSVEVSVNNKRYILALTIEELT